MAEAENFPPQINNLFSRYKIFCSVPQPATNKVPPVKRNGYGTTNRSHGGAASLVTTVTSSLVFPVCFGFVLFFLFCLDCMMEKLTHVEKWQKMPSATHSLTLSLSRLLQSQEMTRAGKIFACLIRFVSFLFDVVPEFLIAHSHTGRHRRHCAWFLES